MLVDDSAVFSADDDIGFDVDEATAIARETFGVQFLSPWQRFVIANVLDSARLAAARPGFSETGDDEAYCRGRQIVILPTGSGKSLCFLVPALLLDGATLVLYPLRALMEDQRRRMEEAGIECAILHGGQTAEERERVFARVAHGAKIILANPEVLQDERLVSRIAAHTISHVAIDEAHCVFEWGTSFRPAYLTLPRIVRALGATVVTAFTATASPAVLDEIGRIMFDGHFHLLRGEIDRPNIHYEVKYAYAKENAVLECAATCSRPMIVFCRTRKRAEHMARRLSEYAGRDAVRFYHAGMTDEEKRAAERWFFNSRNGIITATCALGMGMDKGNVRTVVHADAPEHLEDFCQESGRAGRNGDCARSIVIWSRADTARHERTDKRSRAWHMGAFALSRSCRRQLMLDYMGGEQAVCPGCDVCDAQKSGGGIDFRARDAEAVISFIRKNRRMFTRSEAARQLAASFNRECRSVFGKNVWEAKDISEILAQLAQERRIIICEGLWKNRLDVPPQEQLLFRLFGRLRLRLGFGRGGGSPDGHALDFFSVSNNFCAQIHVDKNDDCDDDDFGIFQNGESNFRYFGNRSVHASIFGRKCVKTDKDLRDGHFFARLSGRAAALRAAVRFSQGEDCGRNVLIGRKTSVQTESRQKPRRERNHR